MNHPAMIVLRHQSESQLLNEHNTDWLQNVILTSVPVNLSFAVDFYDRFTRPNDGIVTPEQREELRVALGKVIQDKVRTDSDLAPHLNDSEALVIWSLITNTKADDGTSAFDAWSKHLAPILASGARNHPEEFLPELANLVGTSASNTRTSGQYPPTFKHTYEMDRDRARVLLRGFLDDALVELAAYEGKNPYARRAKKEAAAWLRELHDNART